MRILLVLTTPPYQSIKVQEGLDLALMLAAMGHTLGLVLAESAVWLLQPSQHTEDSGLRNLLKLLDSLALYDIHQCYIYRPHHFFAPTVWPVLWQRLNEQAMHRLCNTQDEVLYW